MESVMVATKWVLAGYWGLQRQAAASLADRQTYTHTHFDGIEPATI